MYTAIQIANHIINKCIELERSISNLQLQKILYYAQGEYMKQNNGEELFEDDIIAWQYGPVVTDVYYKFNSYSSSNINVTQPKSDIDEITINIINPIIEEKSLLSAWKLVEKTHKEDPWMSSYEEGKSNIIEKSTMKEFFCREN